MNTELQKLVDLQTVGQEIHDLKTSLDLIPGQLEKGRVELEVEKKDLNEATQVMEDLQKKRRELEQEVQKENDHMAKVKTHLPAVKTNKEYTAILTEVDGIKVKVQRIEDEELEIMEQLEVREATIPGLKLTFKEDEEKFTIYKAKKEQEKVRTEGELEAAHQKHQELLGSIAPKWAKHYQKVASFRGENVVVKLEDGVCQGCYQTTLPQMAIDIRKGEGIFECAHCNRILYFVPKPEENPEEEKAVSK